MVPARSSPPARPRFGTLAILAHSLLAILLSGAPAQGDTCPDPLPQAVVCSFADTTTSIAHCQAGQACATRVMVGCGADYFCPGDKVTRDDMAVHLEHGLHGSTYLPPCVSSSWTRFPDVPWTNGFAPWIAQLAEDGITLGNPDGTYQPNGFVIRATMSLFIARTIVKRWPAAFPNGIPTSGTGYNCVSGGSSLFTDVPPTHYACKEIHFLSSLCVAQGFGNGFFGQGYFVDREQMALFLWRAFVAFSSAPPSCPMLQCTP